MSSMLQKAKTQNVRIWSKEIFISGEGANQEDGRPNSGPNHLAQWARLRGFKGLREKPPTKNKKLNLKKKKKKIILIQHLPVKKI